MKLILLSAIPCSRIDLMACCNDGRGGWVYSQCDPCRVFTDFNGPCRLFFALSIFTTPCRRDEKVESTRLVARAGTQDIGTGTLEWQQGHWGIHLEDGAVFSWPQSVSVSPVSNGLVTVDIYVKVRSRENELRVEQPAHCHIREEDRDAMQKSRFDYFLSRLRQKAKTFR